MQPDNSNIQEQPVVPAPAPADAVLPAGIPDGAEVTNILGELTGEIVVYEYSNPDDPTEITGWHKEVNNG